MSEIAVFHQPSLGSMAKHRTAMLSSPRATSDIGFLERYIGRKYVTSRLSRCVHNTLECEGLSQQRNQSWALIRTLLGSLGGGGNQASTLARTGGMTRLLASGLA